MHPILAHRERFAIYMAGWLLFGVMLTAMLTLRGGSFTLLQAAPLALPLTLIYGLMCLSSWYLCRVFPLQKTPFLQLFLLFLIASVVTSIIWILLGYGWLLVQRWLFSLKIENELYFNQVPVMLGLGIVLYIISVALHYLIVAFESSKESEQHALQMRILAQDAELKALRAQIDPHFLFNSLNSISALTTQDPHGARTMTLLLAEFLRKGMNYGGEDTITFAQELALISNFLEIEKVRFGDRLRFETKIDPITKNCLVPPLILQPVVENAVRHGIAHLIDGGAIQLTAEWRGSRLHLVVENPCDPDRPPGKTNGLGLDNVKKRLRAVYGTDAFVDFHPAPESYRIEIIMPARTEGSAFLTAKRPNGHS
ncbi:MAG: histidine kinase [bacterium]